MMRAIYLFVILTLFSCTDNTLNLELYKNFESGRAGEIFSGASALVFHKNKYYVARDNSNSIYIFDKDFNLLKEISIFDGTLPEDSKERKKLKPDLEAAVVIPSDGKGHDQLLLVPSGSKENRVKGAMLELEGISKRGNKITRVDFTSLYKFLKNKVGKVNIEGAVLTNRHLMFFQRGNSKKSKNAIIYLKRDFSRNENGEIFFNSRYFVKIVYPDIGEKNGVLYTFTDAILLNENILFLAAAEETDDAFFDGDVSGMSLGVLDLDGRVLLKKELNTDIKLEGVSLLSYENESQTKIKLFLISDADSDKESSSIYKYTLDLSN